MFAISSFQDVIKDLRAYLKRMKDREEEEVEVTEAL